MNTIGCWSVSNIVKSKNFGFNQWHFVIFTCIVGIFSWWVIEYKKSSSNFIFKYFVKSPFLLFSGNSLISQPPNYSVINQFGSPSHLRPAPVYPITYHYWGPAFNGPLSPTYFPVQMSSQTFNHFAAERTLVSFLT